MAYDIKEEYLDFRKKVRRFAVESVRPVVSAYDKTLEFPRQLFEEYCANGFLACEYNPDTGELSYNMVKSMIGIEEVSREFGSLGLALCVQLQCCMTLVHGGTSAQRKKWLPDMLTGKILMSFAMTEESGGSDAYGIATTASKRDDGWVLNGSKCFITSAGVSDAYIIVTHTDTSVRDKEITMFFVPADSPGFAVMPRNSFVGFNNTPHATIRMTDCFVPDICLLGEVDNSQRLTHTTLKHGRTAFAAIAIGLAEGAFHLARDYTLTRNNFGRPLYVNQGVSFPLAEMYTNIYMARTSLYRVAKGLTNNNVASSEVAALKLFSTEMSLKACSDAMLLHGGIGFTHESDIMRILRDAQMLRTAEGTSQICKVIISNHISKAEPDFI